MVRADVIDLIDRILRTFGGGDRRKPFGGKQLLLVGDVFQLEPVVTPEDKSILQKSTAIPSSSTPAYSRHSVWCR